MNLANILKALLIIAPTSAKRFPGNSIHIEHKGDMVVLQTDGVWEAMNPAGEVFGKERFLGLLMDMVDDDMNSIPERIFAAVDEYREGGPRKDDYTMVIVRVEAT